MYAILLTIHSYTRWLVLLGMVAVLWRSWRGMQQQTAYTPADKLWRTLTVAVTHIQLVLGFYLYSLESPITLYFLKHGFGESFEFWFFGLYHAAMMVLAIVVMTLGGAFARRASSDYEKHRLTLLYFVAALGFILVAIPWFRPLVRIL